MPTQTLLPNRFGYAIYPSLLDGFQRLLDAGDDWAELWGGSEEPALSAAEYELKLEKELVDSINRCLREASEAPDRGTAFNELVDMRIHGRGCTLSGMEVGAGPGGSVSVRYNGFGWLFDAGLVDEVAGRYAGAISQYCVGAPLETDFGPVWLYGYLDEWCADTIFDLKTTTNYTFGKFSRSWQKHLYPYAAVESGDCASIGAFEYTVVKFSAPTAKNPVLTGTVYPETYTFTHEQNRRMLRGICERFIGWLESRRGLITDRRIFGGCNPPGYAGRPVEAGAL